MQRERLTRVKKDGGVPTECIAEVLSIAGITPADVNAVVFSRAEFARSLYKLDPFRRLRAAVRGGSRDLSTAMAKSNNTDPTKVLNIAKMMEAYGLRADCPVFFANHHLSHALPALFYTDWDDALLYTADGAGDLVNYSHRVFKDGRLDVLFGDDRWMYRPYRTDSMARAYAAVTKGLGFRPLHHEGKLTGLAARGRPVLKERFDAHFRMDENGLFESDFATIDAMDTFFIESCKDVSREDAAASIQLFTEDWILASVKRLLEQHPVRHLGLAGGLFANVRLNQRLAEECGLDEIFIVPPMGDEGIVIGGGLQYLLSRDGLETWLSKRYRLENVYWGRSFGDADRRIIAYNTTIIRIPGEPAATAARLMAEGKAVAVFSQRMEYGPRALGARSIMASPARRDINDSLNQRLDREEFMPFAPVVIEENAEKVFHITTANAYACRFMTITCAVRQEWRDRIPAVVHVDNTARPQIVRRRDNPLYYDILVEFERESGLPVAVNTSFNVHEQPIINTPEEAATALVEGRVDYLVTENGVFGLDKKNLI